MTRFAVPTISCGGFRAGTLWPITGGVMIESRWHRHATDRFGLRAVGRQPVCASTALSSSCQRPLFA